MNRLSRAEHLLRRQNFCCHGRHVDPQPSRQGVFYCDMKDDGMNNPICPMQKVLHDDLLKEDATKRDPNSDEQLGVVRDTYTREVIRGPMDGAA